MYSSLAIALLVVTVTWTEGLENNENPDDISDVFSFVKPMVTEGEAPSSLEGVIQSLLPDSEHINANKAIDRLLRILSPLIPNKAKVSDIGTDMNFHDCFVEGLSSLGRAGDVSLNITNGKLTLTFGLAIDQVSLQCAWQRKVLVMTLIGTGKVDVQKIGVSVIINVDVQSGAHPTVQEFSVLHLDGAKTSFTGLGFLNRLAGRIGTVLIKSSKEKIVNKLEGEVAKKLQKVLDRVKVPKF